MTLPDEVAAQTLLLPLIIQEIRSCIGSKETHLAGKIPECMGHHSFGMAWLMSTVAH